MGFENIHIMQLGFLGTNCYIVKSNNNNAAVIDPGDNADKIISYLEKNNLTAKYILLTHGHFDHIGGVNELQEKTGATVMIHQDDTDIACDPKVRATLMRGLENVKPITPDKFINDGDVISFDDVSLEVLHTPGHTKGGVCYILDKELGNGLNGYIFSGDTLFEESIGRTDLLGGDYSALMRSLNLLSNFDGDYIVFPGHGDKTSLSHERKYNQYLGKGASRYDDYF